MPSLAVILAVEVVAALVMLQAHLLTVTKGWMELKAASGLASLLGPRMVAVTAIAIVLLLSMRRDLPAVERFEPLGRASRVILLAFNALSFALVLACALGFESSSPVSYAAVFLAGLTGTVLSAARLAADDLGPAAKRALVLVSLAAVAAFAAVLAVRGTAWAVDPLSNFAWRSAATVLAALGESVVAPIGTRRLEVGDFRVLISAGCSGVEGLALMLLGLTGYLVAFRRSLRFPAALALIPIGLALIWLTNLARIVILMLIGAKISPAVAMGGFHTQAGWIFFNACILGLVLASQRMRLFTRDTGVLGDAPPSALYLAPLLASAAISLAVGIFVAEFDWYYPVRVVFLLSILALVMGRIPERLLKVDAWGIGAGVVTYAVWIALERLRLAPELDANAAVHIASVPRSLVAAWIVARAIGAVVVVPLAEELAFRGFLARRIQAEDFVTLPYTALRWPAIAVSSVAFGLAHGQVAGAIIAGVLYSLAAKRTGSLGTAVFAHAVTNALIAVHVLVTGRWSLWG